MKIEIKKLKKLFKHGQKKNRMQLINPLRDWTIGLASAVLFSIVAIAFTSYDFYIQLVSTPETLVEEQPILYREKEVRFYAELYLEKEQNFQNLRQTNKIFQQDLQTEIVIENSEDGRVGGGVIEDVSVEPLADEPIDE